MWQNKNDHRNARTIALFLFVGLIFGDAIVAFYLLREKISSNITEQANLTSMSKVVYSPLVLNIPEQSDSSPAQVPTPESVMPAPEAETYVVQSGDTLFGIAVDHNVLLEDLVRVNQIQDVDLILVGQELIIPISTGMPETPIESSTPYP
jgi:LysM repeat protein